MSLTRLLFVDAGAASSQQDGSLANPYLTIQAAVDAVDYPRTAADSDKEWIVLIAPGDYDEDVRVEGPVRLALIGLGAFRLGRYTVAGATQANIVAAAGAPPKNLVWLYDSSQLIVGGAAPQLVIGTIGGTDVIRHGKPIANRISGSIVVQGAGWTSSNAPKGGTAFLAVANTQVDAGITKSQATPPDVIDENGNSKGPRPAIDATGLLEVVDANGDRVAQPFSGILVDRHFNSRFRGRVLGALTGVVGEPPAHMLATSFMSQYEGLVQVSGYASIQQAAFADGMTVSQVPKLESLKSVVPPGIVNSTFSGTFSGPAGSLLLDAATNTWFIRNLASLGGGATKAFLGGASQTLRVQVHAGQPALITTLEDSHCGVTLLADATNGQIRVKLPSAVGKDDLTFTIKNIGTKYKVTVEPTQGEEIDGMAICPLGPLVAPPPLGPLVAPPGIPASAIKIVAHRGRWWIVARG